MKIKETKNDLEIKVPKMKCEQEFQPPAPYPLANKPHVYMFVGAKGSGKTSSIINMLTNKTKKEKNPKTNEKLFKKKNLSLKYNK